MSWRPEIQQEDFLLQAGLARGSTYSLHGQQVVIVRTQRNKVTIKQRAAMEHRPGAKPVKTPTEEIFETRHPLNHVLGFGVPNNCVARHANFRAWGLDQRFKRRAWNLVRTGYLSPWAYPKPVQGSQRLSLSLRPSEPGSKTKTRYRTQEVREKSVTTCSSF